MKIICRHKSSIVLIIAALVPPIFTVSSLSAESEKINFLYLDREPTLKSHTTEWSEGSAQTQLANTVTVSTRLVKEMSRDTIIAIQNLMRGTCAEQSKFSINIDAKGKVLVVEAGLGGSIEITVLNPEKSADCKNK